MSHEGVRPISEAAHSWSYDNIMYCGLGRCSISDIAVHSGPGEMTVVNGGSS